MSDLPKRIRQERPVLHPSYDIVDMTEQRKRMAREIGQQMIDGLSKLDEQPADRLKNALRRGGADGSIGADFFYDETWYDTPPPPKGAEDVATRIAQLQQQTREEQ